MMKNTFNINSIFYKANISGKKIWAQCQCYGLQKTYRKCLSFDITTNNPKRKEIGMNVGRSISLQNTDQLQKMERGR